MFLTSEWAANKPQMTNRRCCQDSVPAGEPWTGISAPFTLIFKGAAPAAQQQHSLARERSSPCEKHILKIQVPVQVIFQ